MSIAWETVEELMVQIDVFYCQRYDFLGKLLPTTLPQIFCEITLNLNVIVKNI